MGGKSRSPGVVRGDNIVVELDNVWVRYSGSGKPAIRVVSYTHLTLPTN